MTNLNLPPQRRGVPAEHRAPEMRSPNEPGFAITPQPVERIGTGSGEPTEIGKREAAELKAAASSTKIRDLSETDEGRAFLARHGAASYRELPLEDQRTFREVAQVHAHARDVQRPFYLDLFVKRLLGTAVLFVVMCAIITLLARAGLLSDSSGRVAGADFGIFAAIIFPCLAPLMFFDLFTARRPAKGVSVLVNVMGGVVFGLTAVAALVLASVILRAMHTAEYEGLETDSIAAQALSSPFALVTVFIGATVVAMQLITAMRVSTGFAIKTRSRPLAIVMLLFALAEMVGLVLACMFWTPQQAIVPFVIGLAVNVVLAVVMGRLMGLEPEERRAEAPVQLDDALYQRFIG